MSDALLPTLSIELPLQSNLILVAGLVDHNALLHRHLTDDLLAEEVADLEELASVNRRDVDGEMGIHQLHGVLVTPLHAREHVLHVAARRANGRELARAAEPLLDANAVEAALLLGPECLHLEVETFEVPVEGATRASHLDLARLDLHLDIPM